MIVLCLWKGSVDTIEDNLRHAESELRKVTRGADFTATLDAAKHDYDTLKHEQSTLEFFTMVR